MRLASISVVASAALAVGLPASAQNAPSNAELFQMFKAQQRTLAKQEALVDELRAELRKSRAALKQTQGDVKRGGQQVRQLAAHVDRVSTVPIARGSVAGRNAFAAKPEPNTFAIDASYLYLKPSLNDTYFVITGTAAGSPNGTLYANDPSYGSAFRIGAAYTNGLTGRKLMVSYSQLASSSVKQVSGSNLWAARGSADLLANFENYTGSATSDIDLKYRRADLLMSEPVTWLGSDLSFLYGIEYASMNWDETETYARAVTGVSTSSAKFNGVGPQIGFSLSYKPFADLSPFMSGFSIDTKATGSLLLATSSSSISDVFNGTNIGNVQTDPTVRVIPVMHARLGLAYSYGWDQLTTTMKAGYEYNSYINGLQRLGNHDDVADGQYTTRYNNFDLSGFYATLGVKMPL